jgi:hypothetical protein
MARLLGASFYWNAWGNNWLGSPWGKWPKPVQVAFKRRQRRRERRQWCNDEC